MLFTGKSELLNWLDRKEYLHTFFLDQKEFFMKKTSLTICLCNENVQVFFSPLLYADRFKWRTFRHCNAEYELHIIISGSCTLDVEGDVYPLSAGDALVVAPNCFHSASRVSDKFERLSLSLVVDPKSHIAELLCRLNKLSVIGLSEKQIELCRLFIQEVTNCGLYHVELFHAYLTMLLISVFRLSDPKFNTTETPFEKIEFQPRHLVDKFFSSWPTPVGSEEELAKLLSISRRQVVRILKQSYNMTFREKYMRSKMDYAAWLLRSTELRTKEIARQVNYSSESVFMSSFKKYFGMTTTEYRKTYVDNKKDESK